MMDKKRYKKLKEKKLLTQERIDEKSVKRKLKMFDVNTGEPLDDAEEVLTLPMINDMVAQLRDQVNNLDKEKNRAEMFLDAYPNQLEEIQGNIEYWEDVKADFKETVKNRPLASNVKKK